MRISLILNGGDRKAQLVRTLESVKTQHLQPDEIIIAHDDFGGAPHISHTWNKSIREASGDILILQNAEVMYTTHWDIQNLIYPVIQRSLLSCIPCVQCLDKDGLFEEWYVHPVHNNRILNFCQVVRREHIANIGGFDEQYIGYGCDDDDFEFRLQASGVKVEIRQSVVVQHQWHSHNVVPDADQLGDTNRARFVSRKAAIESGVESFKVESLYVKPNTEMDDAGG